MKKLFSKEGVIGICVIIALVVLFYGIEFLKGNNPFVASNSYYAVYNDVKGLQVSANVNVNGFKIGSVKDVRLMYDRPGYVLVEMDIEEEYKIPVNSRAFLESDLLGTASIRLDVEPGDVYYALGDTLKSELATGMMDAVSKDVLPAVAQIGTKVDSLVSNLNNITGDPAIINSLRNIEALTATLNSTASALNTTVATLPKLANDVNNVVATVDGITNDLKALTAQLSEAPVDSTLNNVNRISNDLAALTSQLHDTNSTLGALLNDKGLYDNLTGATKSLDSLLIDIRENPKRYISIKLL